MGRPSRYVERDALRAGLVQRAEAWQWSSLWRRQQSDAQVQKILSPWPVAKPRRWLAIVNGVEPASELEQFRTSVQRGRPYGGAGWLATTAKELGLESTFGKRGRPPKPGTAKGS